VRDDDGEANELRQLVVAWDALCKGEGKEALSAADALKAIKPDPITKCSRYDELFELLTGMSKKGDLPTNRGLGNYLGKFRGKVVTTENGPKALQRIPLHGNMLWFVKNMPSKKPPGSGGSGGSGGSASRYPVTKTDFFPPRQASETEEEKGEKGGSGGSGGSESRYPVTRTDFSPPDKRQKRRRRRGGKKTIFMATSGE
jgi:hypothetical protein